MPSVWKNVYISTAVTAMGYGISFPPVKTRTTAGDASGLPVHLSAFLGKMLEGVLIVRLYPYLQQK